MHLHISTKLQNSQRLFFLPRTSKNYFSLIRIRWNETKQILVPKVWDAQRGRNQSFSTWAQLRSCKVKPQVWVHCFQKESPQQISTSYLAPLCYLSPSAHTNVLLCTLSFQNSSWLDTFQWENQNVLGKSKTARCSNQDSLILYISFNWQG